MNSQHRVVIIYGSRTNAKNELDTLLDQGWKVVSVTGTGTGDFAFVLEKVAQ